MAKLSKTDIVKMLNDKGFQPVDIDQYQNLESPISIKCKKGHITNTTLKKARKATFKCPKCMGGTISISASEGPPDKKGSRVIALDNASEDMGVSIFDDGELVFYTIIKYSGYFDQRLTAIFETMHEFIIPKWDPDYLVFEDVQYQRNYNTYKKLSMLLGTLISVARYNGIKNETVASKRWRSKYQIANTRNKAKAEAVALVKEMYNIEVVHDIAEAILLGKYAADLIMVETMENAF